MNLGFAPTDLKKDGTETKNGIKELIELMKRPQLIQNQQQELQQQQQQQQQCAQPVVDVSIWTSMFDLVVQT